jgi:hypothetical protein
VATGARTSHMEAGHSQCEMDAPVAFLSTSTNG